MFLSRGVLQFLILNMYGHEGTLKQTIYIKYYSWLNYEKSIMLIAQEKKQ